MKRVLSTLLVSSMIGSQAFAFKGVENCALSNGKDGVIKDGACRDLNLDDAAKAAQDISAREVGKLAVTNAALWALKLHIEKNIVIAESLQDSNEAVKIGVPLGLGYLEIVGTGAAYKVSNRLVNATDKGVNEYYKRYRELTKNISDLEKELKNTRGNMVYRVMGAEPSAYKAEIERQTALLEDHIASSGEVFAKAGKTIKVVKGLRDVLILGVWVSVMVDAGTTFAEIQAQSPKDLKDWLETINTEIEKNDEAMASYF
jgi:hypothetical protein